jgi:hypothetical protein
MRGAGFAVSFRDCYSHTQFKTNFNIIMRLQMAQSPRQHHYDQLRWQKQNLRQSFVDLATFQRSLVYYFQNPPVQYPHSELEAVFPFRESRTRAAQ